MPEQPPRSEIRDWYESEQDPPVDCHENYGDVNPEGHGGVWVTYDDGEWTAYETTISSEVGFEDAGFEDAGDQYVTMGYVQWRDLVTESGEWTDTAKRFVDTFHNSHEYPMGAVVDGRMTALVAWFITDRQSHPVRAGTDGRIQKDNYEQVLSAVGIDPCE
jgi:hypothetical protein